MKRNVLATALLLCLYPLLALMLSTTAHAQTITYMDIWLSEKNPSLTVGAQLQVYTYGEY